jgi:hypothetical protein
MLLHGRHWAARNPINNPAANRRCSVPDFRVSSVLSFAAAAVAAASVNLIARHATDKLLQLYNVTAPGSR